jgi:hypothetical protein
MTGSDNATVGLDASKVSPTWTNHGTFTCAAQLPIYGVQQPEQGLRSLAVSAANAAETGSAWPLTVR